jgi:hypothetical protein
MSAERELLKEVLYVIGVHTAEAQQRTNILINNIQKLLTQPEREPMTGKEISQGFRADKDATNAESYWAGVALAEKHYGVDDE